MRSADSQPVEASFAGDSTEPQPAPDRRPTPVSLQPIRSAARSRRETLVSPIPALMAASMRDTVGKDAMVAPPSEAVPVAAQQDQAALRFDDEPDYVVEIDASKKHG